MTLALVNLVIILAAAISIGGGTISTTHWAFRCHDGIVLMDGAGTAFRLSEVQCEEFVNKQTPKAQEK